MYTVHHARHNTNNNTNIHIYTSLRLGQELLEFLNDVDGGIAIYSDRERCATS